MTVYFKDLPTVKTWCNLTSKQVDEIEREMPGRILTRATGAQGEIDGRLRKRAANLPQYPIPFPEPVPPKVLEWMGWLLTPVLYELSGLQMTDEMQQRIERRSDRAYEQIKEAADAVDGLYDLPFSADSQESMIAEPATLFRSDPNCFAFKHRAPAGGSSSTRGPLV